MAMAFVCLSVNAQYKKASFLNKAGRTYDLGFTGHLISEGMVPGIFYSYGKDNGTKRLFHWFDLELLLPSKFKYTTEDVDTKEAVTVKGSSKVGLIYRYNLGCYLLDNTKEGAKFLPFVTGGINVLLLGGTAKDYTTSPENVNPVKVATNQNFSAGANAGIGMIYSFTSKFGLKAAAGYNYQYNKTPSSWSDGVYSVYNVYTSHPYVSVGLHFRMENDD
jgi:hypothetical protein